MRTRKLGKSEIPVGEVALGTWGLTGEAYGPVDPEIARATVEAALDSGVTLIETAHCYGHDGETEKMIGEVLHARGRSSAMVCTRVGVERTVNANGSEVVRKRFEGQPFIEMTHTSLKRLQTDYVDILLMHNPRPGSFTVHKDALFTLRTEGLARLVGVSVGSVEVGREALRQDIDVIELPYNALFPRILNGLSPEIISSGVGVIVRSPLAYGLLADTWSDKRRFEEGDHRMERWTPQEIAQRVQQRECLRFLVDHEKPESGSDENGNEPRKTTPMRSMREAALRYVLANKMISTMVVGARTPDQARENTSVAGIDPYLTIPQLSRVAQEMRAVGIKL